MARRRLLILCYFYPPLAGGGVHRVLALTRHLPEHGWDCTVVCAGAQDYWVTDESLVSRIPQATEVIRVPGGSALSALLKLGRGAQGRRSGRAFGSLRRLSDWWLLPDSYAGWAARARRAASRRLEAGGIDAVLSSSPPDSVHLAALGLRRFSNVPWIADFRDPWIALNFREPPTAWHRSRQAAMERRVLERADAVVVASRTHERTLGAKSGARVPASRVHHVPNGFEGDTAGTSGADATGALASTSAAVVAADAPTDRTHFRLAFTGTLSLMPDTEVFLEAVHEMLKRQPAARRSLRARLAGPFDSGYDDRAVALGLRGIVEFTGPLAHEASRRLQREADLLLLWKPRGTLTMVPGKLYEYLDAGRPIVAVLDAGDEAAELAARGGAERVAPGDREALSAVIERHWLAWREGASVPSSRPAWLDEHRRDRLALVMAGVLDALVERRS
jgi:glycosyltransferase involved in cell wall biosynthesis